MLKVRRSARVFPFSLPETIPPLSTLREKNFLRSSWHRLRLEHLHRIMAVNRNGIAVFLYPIRLPLTCCWVRVIFQRTWPLELQSGREKTSAKVLLMVYCSPTV